MSDTKRRTLRAWWARQGDYERREIRRICGIVLVIISTIALVIWTYWYWSGVDAQAIRDCEDRLSGTAVEIEGTVVCFAPGVVLSS